MTFQGMNRVHIDETAEAMTEAHATLTTLRSTLQSSIDALRWNGEDAELWQQGAREAVGLRFYQALGELDALRQQLEEEALDQRRASSMPGNFSTK